MVPEEINVNNKLTVNTASMPSSTSFLSCFKYSPPFLWSKNQSVGNDKNSPCFTCKTGK